VNDFRAIGRFVPWVHETNAAHVAFLAENMRRGDVVVTHHLPHPRSVDAQYAGEPSNRFFLAANAAPLVEAGLAQLWIHGHTHLPCDYVEHGTRVVCNPLGYPAERKPPYDPAFVIEVGSQHVER
jgi:predicted phosphodiesterase